MKYNITMVVEGDSANDVIDKIRSIFSSAMIFQIGASLQDIEKNLPDGKNKIAWIRRYHEISGHGLTECFDEYNRRFEFPKTNKAKRKKCS